MYHIASAFNSFSLCLARECKGCEQTLQNESRDEITRWLRFQGVGADAMYQLRQIVEEAGDGSFLQLMSDAEVVDRLGSLIASGRLLICGALLAKTAVISKVARKGAPPPAAPPARPQPPRPQSQPTSQPRFSDPGAAAPDPNDTFGSSLEVADMVAVLVQAAELGVPFCEECARAAAARAAA